MGGGKRKKKRDEQEKVKKKGKKMSDGEENMEICPMNDETLIDFNGGCSIQDEPLIDFNSSVRAEFADSYSFRNTVEYIRVNNSAGAFRFYEDRIIYEQANSKQTLLNQFIIYANELTDYEFNSKSGIIVLNVNLAELRQRTKTIGKKDRLAIYKMPQDKNMYLEIYSQNSSNMGEHPNIHCIETMPPAFAEYNIHEYDRQKRPLCTIHQGDFAKCCSSFIAVKCSHVIAHGYPRGIVFEGKKQTGETTSCKKFGKCKTDISAPSPASDKLIVRRIPNATPAKLVFNDERIDYIIIPSEIIKSLSKLNNLSTNGTIKIYFEENSPLCLICNIGTYGELTVHILQTKE